MNQSDTDSWNQSKAYMHKKTTNQKIIQSQNHKTISDKIDQSEKNLSSHKLPY